MLINTINKCDIDLRKNLYQEIVLAGGNTMIDYFPERLLSSVKKNVN
jgi:centractin